jgi:hypothetical protein
MALVGATHDDGGRLGSRTIDPSALLAALDDLERPTTSRG